jgi:hypothetical protein
MTATTTFGASSGQARGKNAYGNLSQRYANGFEQKWISGAMQEEQLLGTADIQSPADLRNGYDVVRTMRASCPLAGKRRCGC